MPIVQGRGRPLTGVVEATFSTFVLLFWYFRQRPDCKLCFCFAYCGIARSGGGAGRPWCAWASRCAGAAVPARCRPAGCTRWPPTGPCLRRTAPDLPPSLHRHVMGAMKQLPRQVIYRGFSKSSSKEMSLRLLQSLKTVRLLIVEQICFIFAG